MIIHDYSQQMETESHVPVTTNQTYIYIYIPAPQKLSKTTALQVGPIGPSMLRPKLSLIHYMYICINLCSVYQYIDAQEQDMYIYSCISRPLCTDTCILLHDTLQFIVSCDMYLKHCTDSRRWYPPIISQLYNSYSLQI